MFNSFFPNCPPSLKAHKRFIQRGMEGVKGIYIIIFFYHIIHDSKAQENLSKAIKYINSNESTNNNNSFNLGPSSATPLRSYVSFLNSRRWLLGTAVVF